MLGALVAVLSCSLASGPGFSRPTSLNGVGGYFHRGWKKNKFFPHSQASGDPSHSSVLAELVSLANRTELVENLFSVSVAILRQPGPALHIRG
jgi:hypothetical protein